MQKTQQQLLLLLRFVVVFVDVVPLLLRWHYSSMRPFAPVLDISQSALLFDLSFKSVILHLLISVCTQFHHLILVVLLVDFPENYC
jgi:hypothetical protein